MAKDPDGYKVGYRRPPLGSRFKKGRSGNPRGRPQGSKNLRAALEDILNQRIAGHVNGRRRTMTILEAILTRLAQSAVGGDLKAAKMLFDHDRSQGDDRPTEPRRIVIIAQPGDEDI